MAQSETGTEEQRPRIFCYLWGLRRLTLGLLALGLSGVLVGLLLTGWFLSEQRYVAFLERELEQFLRAEVEIASSTLSLRQGVGVQFETISVQEYGSPAPFVTAERIDLVLDLGALLRGQLLFRQLFVLKPSIRLAQPPSNAEPATPVARMFSRLVKPLTQEAEAEETPSDTNLWFSPQLLVHQLVLEDATLVFQRESTGVPLVFTRARLRLSLEPGGGVRAQLSADLGQNGEVRQLTLHSRAAHWEPTTNSFPVKWRGGLHLQNVAVQEVGAWFGADWPSVRADFSGHYTIDLLVHQLVLEDAELVFQQTSDGVPMVFSHARLRIAWDSGGVYGELSADLGQNGEVGQLVFHSHATHEGLIPNASLAEWRGDIRLQNIAVRELGEWFEADWPSARADFVGKYTGRADASTDVSGRMSLRDIRLAPMTIEHVSIGLTDLRWDNPLSASSWLASLTFSATLEKVQGQLGKTNLPVRLASGQLRLQNGQLHASKLKGSYGRSSVLTELNADWGPMFSKEPPTLGVRLAARMNLADDLEATLSLVSSKEREALLSAVHQPSGQADLRLRVQFPPGSGTPLSYATTVEWRSAGLTLPEWGLTVSEVYGVVHLTPEIATLQDIRFHIGTSAGVLEGTIASPFTSSQQGQISLSIPQATIQDIAPLLKSVEVQPQYGQISGRVDARFGPESHLLETEGNITLSQARMDVLSFLEPLDIVRGQFFWQGQQGRFVIEQASLDGGSVAGSGELLSLEPLELHASLECGELDLGSILVPNSVRPGQKQKTAEQSPNAAHQEKQKTEEQSKVRIDVHCDRVQYKTFTAEPVQVSVYRHDRQVDFRLEEASISAGHVRGEGTFWLDSSALSFAPQVSQVDTADFFAALGLPLSGTLDANGNIKVASWAFWNDLEGWDGELTLSVHDGVAQRLPILIRLWTAIQLPQIPREGLPFSSLTGDVIVRHGELTAKNFSFVGEAVRLDAQGQVNLRQKTFDITGDFIPLRGITSVVEKVPLLGKLLAQSTDRLTLLPFQVSGPYHDPQVRLKKPLLKMKLEFGLD